MIVLIRHFYARMMRRGRVIGLIALASVPAMIYWLVAFDADADDLQPLYTDIVASAGYTFAIAALILTVATLREERDGGTLPYVYMRPIARSFIAVAALAAGSAAAVTIALAGWAATALAVLAVGADLSVAVPGLALYISAAIGYAAIFVPLGYLVPRSLLVGLGYIVIGDAVLGNAVPGLAQISMWRIAMSVYAGVEENLGEVAAEVLDPVTAGVGGGVLKIAGTLVVGFLVLTWALRRRDAL